ncbi:MAG TPA: MFS transporter [Streptosporangiaceae bacterium]
MTPRRTARGPLALLAAAEFMLTLDLSIVNVALPAIRDELGFTEGSLQWVVNGYALAFAGFLLLGGRAGDLFGGRPVFLAALGGFSLAGLACGLAGTPWTLVAARAVQGLSAGLLAPTTLGILASTYRTPAARNRALAVWTAVAIGGGAAGGLLGGLLTSVLSWRWIFLVNVPIGAVLLAAAARRLPRDVEPRTDRPGLDVAGAIAVTCGLVALVWGLIRSAAAGWGAGEVIGAFALAAVLLAGFVLYEARLAAAPLVPLAIFRARPVWAGNLLALLGFLPVPATWFFLTIYLQRELGLSPPRTGLSFLPLSLAVVGGAQAGFRLIRRLDARALFAAGGLTAAAGLAGLARLSPGTGLPFVIVSATVAMLGGGLMFAPVTVAATSVAAHQEGLAGGLLNTARQIGGALGLAVLETIAAARAAGPAAGAAERAAGTAGYTAAFATGAAVFLVTAVAGAIALPARLGRTGHEGRRPGRQGRRHRGRWAPAR